VDPVFADRQLGTQLMFCNTYHLIVHPGADAVAAAGGIHQFNKYSKPIITDSGGFQVFSLGNTEAQDELKGKVISKSRKLNQGGGSSIVRLNEQGVLFRSYLNGDLIELSPETSVEAQKKFQSDIIVPLDILLPNATTEKRRMASLHRTHRWEARSLVTHLQNLNNQAMYCVLHGGTDRTMRTLSAKYLLKLPFQGVAIGGSLGKNREEMIQVVSLLSDMIPKDKPVHLLGAISIRVQFVFGGFVFSDFCRLFQVLAM
jgi:queuine tRNA-ribosyltransferase